MKLCFKGSMTPEDYARLDELEELYTEMTDKYVNEAIDEKMERDNTEEQ